VAHPNELDVTNSLYGDLQLSETRTDQETETTFSQKANGTVSGTAAPSGQTHM